MNFVFDVRAAKSPFVELIWHTRSEGAGTFTSAATDTWELVFTTVGGQTTVTARGPETRASQADSPADAEFLGITFKLGTFMPQFPVKTLLDRQDVTLPQASSRSFWLHGSAWQLPTSGTADLFVDKLVRQGLLVRDPLVAATLRGHRSELSPRALQYRFLQATGLPYKTIQQIQRAHRAVSLLERGTPAAVTAAELGYFDQAHLTHSLRRFVGTTPAQIAVASSLV